MDIAKGSELNTNSFLSPSITNIKIHQIKNQHALHMKIMKELKLKLVKVSSSSKYDIKFSEHKQEHCAAKFKCIQTKLMNIFIRLIKKKLLKSLQMLKDPPRFLSCKSRHGASVGGTKFSRIFSQFYVCYIFSLLVDPFSLMYFK